MRRIKSKSNRFMEKFALKAEDHKIKMREILENFSEKKIIGFGSSARSQTFLNYCKFNEKNINLIIDNNSMKQNLYSPGTNIKIVDFNTGINSKSDVILYLRGTLKEKLLISVDQQVIRENLLFHFLIYLKLYNLFLKKLIILRL